MSGFGGLFSTGSGSKSSATTSTTTTSNSGNTTETGSRNTDNSLGDGSQSNSQNRSVSASGITGNVSISDGSPEAISLAATAADRIAATASQALSGAAQLGRDAFAAQGSAIQQAASIAGNRAPTDAKSQVMKLGLVAGAVVVLGVAALLMRKRRAA